MKLVCMECGGDAEGSRCVCGGYLDPRYTEFSSRDHDGMWRYTDLPVEPGQSVSMREGGTPLVELDAPDGVESLLVKDEGRNPTGSVHDRSMSAAVSVVAGGDVEEAVLYSAGDSGVSAAAYCARAGLPCSVYVPSRAPFHAKAMINVHDADMTVVGGRLPEARREARDAGDGARSLSVFENPYVHDALKTVAYEIMEAEPDHVVCPVGSGALYVGLDKGLPPKVGLHAVQSGGCAPIVRAHESGRYSAWESPDTVVGELEDPDPPGAGLVLEALESRGEAAAVSDGDALDAALEAARQGIEMSPAGAVALAGSRELGLEGTVVVVNPSAGGRYADVLRNRLVYHGE